MLTSSANEKFQSSVESEKHITFEEKHNDFVKCVLNETAVVGNFKLAAEYVANNVCAPRFYVGVKSAFRGIRELNKSDNKMYADIRERYESRLANNSSANKSDLMLDVIMSEAPSFYIPAHLAYEYFRRWYKANRRR